MSTALAIRGHADMEQRRRGIQMSSFEDLLLFAGAVVDTPFCPSQFKTKESVALVVAYGQEVGLGPMASLRSICLINGKPALYGDGLLGVVRASGLLESFHEEITGTGEAAVARCTVKRFGQEPLTRTFSVDEARRAKLIDKDGTWKTYPRRMLAMRARGFALRDCFADALAGLVDEYEADDSSSDAPIESSAAEPSRAKQLMAHLHANAPEVAAAMEMQMPIVPAEPFIIEAEPTSEPDVITETELHIGAERAAKLEDVLVGVFGKRADACISKILVTEGVDQLALISPEAEREANAKASAFADKQAAKH